VCGIAGIVDYRNNLGSLEQNLQAMLKSIHHRGPDADGIWIDEQSRVGLGHKRLSIIDLSEEGAQPMHSSNQRYVITYNGEVYNFKEIAKELSSEHSVTFRGHSDTEIILEAIANWGIDKAIAKFNGMFAFAIWDKHDKQLILARDRLGKKPLYYALINGSFVFASELKELKSIRALPLSINPGSVALYFSYGNIPGKHSIYKDVFKLEPGTLLKLNLNQPEDINYSISTYWSVAEKAAENIAHEFTGDLNSATDHLQDLLKDSIKHRMLSDVPLGAFLSGGIDSSLVTAIMQEVSDKPVQTFSIGFHEKKYNEAHFAKEIATHLGTNHTELYVTPEQAMQVIPKLPFLYDEPFSDSSQIPTYLVSEMARDQVTVVLSGDGGDELFCGYDRYTDTVALWNIINKVPDNLKHTVASLLKLFKPLNIGKLHTLTTLLEKCRSVDDVYRHIQTDQRAFQAVNNATSIPPISLTNSTFGNEISDPYNRLMLHDQRGYLIDDILVKVDRASMGVSLESRVPLLDYRLVEFAWSIPMSMKIHDGKEKYILRNLLSRYVPTEMFDRPKKGFAVPVGEWIKSPLRDWAENLLDRSKMNQQGILNTEYIHSIWEQHKSNQVDHRFFMWKVLMFQAWLEENELKH